MIFMSSLTSSYIRYIHTFFAVITYALSFNNAHMNVRICIYIYIQTDNDTAGVERKKAFRKKSSKKRRRRKNPQVKPHMSHWVDSFNHRVCVFFS